MQERHSNSDALTDRGMHSIIKTMFRSLGRSQIHHNKQTEQHSFGLQHSINSNDKLQALVLNRNVRIINGALTALVQRESH